jgi:putative PIN family toxin of toxin-antitoxin system
LTKVATRFSRLADEDRSRHQRFHQRGAQGGLLAGRGRLRSDATAGELRAVLQRPRFATLIPGLYVNNVQRMLTAAERVEISERIAACRDPKDDKFLELAVNGKADIIVSGDDDLLVFGAFRDIPVVDPATFGRSQIP